MSSTQTVSLGSHAARLQATCTQLGEAQYVKRLWEKDAGLWGTDPAVQQLIRQRLGWLSIPRAMLRQVASIRTLAQEASRSGFRHVFLLGMGGSGLFAEVCRHVIGPAPSALDLTVLDTTDPTAIRLAQAQHPLQQLLVVVSSKSGSTSEVAALSKYFYATLASVNGGAGAHCVAITDAGTSLETQALDWKFRRIFTHDAQTGSDVGGRFSALTYFGLVPAALLGIDVERLLQRAVEMLEQCGPEVSMPENPALQLGAALGDLAGQGRDKMTLLCAPALASFGTWVEQLIAESTGKSGKGIVPIMGEPLREASSYPTDRVFLELQLAQAIDQPLARLTEALIRAGHPVIRIHWRDPYDLGGEVVKWEIATAVIGTLLHINPFDEPNVQESKDRTKTLLAQYVQSSQFSAEPIALTEGPLVCYGAPARSPNGSFAQVLAEFLQQAKPHDYVAVLSFLPRTPACDALVAQLRNTLASGLRQATMVGMGPRYLHSTGQLYKGGPDTGLFLFLTAEEPSDLPIPGEPWTFRTLKQAQAIGDVQAMQQRGRRILRIHLQGPPEQVLHHLLQVIHDALAGQSSRCSCA